MLTKLGEKFTIIFQRLMPDAFVFAILLTLITVLVSFIWLDSEPIKILSSWYDGFWSLLEFGMQIVLMIITGFCIALSPVIKMGIDKLVSFLKRPKQVYFFVVLIGLMLSLVSFSWIVITAVLARELAIRIKGINYPFLIACVYFSFNSWVCGLSSSIPLLLSTENNFLINADILTSTISTSNTLGSTLNLAMMGFLVLSGPLLLLLFAPKAKQEDELAHMLNKDEVHINVSIEDEANNSKLDKLSISDILNHNVLIQMIIAVMGVTYILYHFYTKGFELNFNIMIFIFLMIGLILHKTPMRYVIAMKKASSNVSGILFQYPFYAGIMGIMLFTGLGEKLAEMIASVATINTYPFYAYLAGGAVNFAIPSAGGEFAVIGPSIINAVTEIGNGMPEQELTAMIAKASLSIAYGESLSNFLQPFYLLIIFPVMGAGVNIQARDVMGYLILPFLFYFIAQSLIVLYVPM